ncbi:MAG: hypothetical protein K2Y08_06435 [Alphaproteobacteria bacterium]|nr:hypothetical protein [Alphaproteobacteria bacterium]
MKKQLFLLALTTAIFTTHPLFAMVIDENQLSGSIRLQKKEIRSKLLEEDKYALFLPTSEKLRIINALNYDKETISIPNCEVEFSFEPLRRSRLRGCNFYPFQGRWHKDTNLIYVFTRDSIDDGGVDTGTITFTLPKGCDFCPTITREEIINGEKRAHFTLNPLELTPVVFKFSGSEA